MATISKLLLCLSYIILFNCFLGTSSSTHWIVTEDGRIQSQMDSVFSLRRPYDLVAFMRQEERAIVLEDLKQQLLNKKEEIDHNEDKDTGLEQRFYRSDEDCVVAGKPLPEFDLYISTVLPLENKGIRPEEHIDFNAPPTTMPEAPDCTQVINLDFSIHAFEHLEGMKERRNLTGNPELGLKNAITHRDNVDDYGHLVHQALQKNKTSWVLYNMAAFYWRIKGSPFHVIECVRRALHFSPRLQKDVALISLANVLHRSRYSNEAAIVVHAALDVSKELNVNHFTLGNIYAVLAEYNKSVICFENTLKIQPDFEAALKRKHAVRCHAKLESALEAQHRSLQRTLNELKDYQNKHERWQKQQEHLLSEQASPEVLFEQRVGYEEHKLREMSSQMGDTCHILEKDGRQVLHCTWANTQSGFNHDEDNGTDDDGTGGENLSEWQRVERKSASRTVTFEDVKKDYTNPLKAARYQEKNEELPENYPGKMTDWPSRDECDTFGKSYPGWNDFPTTYLPAENKGFDVKAMLSDAQGLREGEQHPLPWYPPECPPLGKISNPALVYDHVDSMKDRAKSPTKLPDAAMRDVLLNLVDKNGVREEDIGQRILTCLKKDIGAKWLLYNLAALYWRVIGSSPNGIECIRQSLHLAPIEYRDIPLVNLANILYKWGRVDDAITVMHEALFVNDFEPETHFFMGTLLMVKANFSGAAHHFEETIKQDPSHQNAFSLVRTLKCFVKFYQESQSSPVRTNSPNTCLPNNCQRTPGSAQEKTEANCGADSPSSACPVCKQTCSVTPIKLETCEQTIDGPDSQKSVGCGATDKKLSEICSHSERGDVLATGDDADLATQLDEITRIYKDAGVCSGDDCQRFMIQCFTPLNMESSMIKASAQQHFIYKPADAPTQQCLNADVIHKPHTQLEFVDGEVKQKLILVESSADDIPVSASDCVIYNDGRRSPGCKREEFKPFVDYHSEIMEQWTDDIVLMNIPQTMFYPEKQEETELPPMTEHGRKIRIYDSAGNEGFIDPKPPKTTKMIHIDIVRKKPDPIRHIHMKEKERLPWPTWDDCTNNHKTVNFNHFFSTWVSVTAKGVNLQDYFDFTSPVEGSLSKPVCGQGEPQAEDSALDLLGSLIRADISPGLDYSAEVGLQETLQMLGSGQGEPVDVVGTRIARAQEKHDNSWVLANLAALYWRVVGNAANAISCIRVAYTYSPNGKEDIALLNLANVLHKSGELSDAALVTDMALQASTNMVTVHFAMANILAAKEDWTKASKFYESTLALQSSFSPAQERLRAIRCEHVLKNPHIYKKEAV